MAEVGDGEGDPDSQDTGQEAAGPFDEDVTDRRPGAGEPFDRVVTWPAPEPAEPAAEAPQQAARGRRRRTIETLVLSRTDLVMGTDGHAYAICPLPRGRREVMRVGGESFSLHLRRVALDLHDTVMGEGALKNAIATAEVRARSSGDVRNVWRRVAQHEGDIYLDRGGADPMGLRDVERATLRGWSAAEDDEGGPLFIRSMDQLPLPEPEAGSASWGDLGQLINADTDQDLYNAWTWLLCAMRPFTGKGGYPLAAFVGEAGSGKSTATLYLHQLIDPTSSALINLSADPRDYPPLLSSRHVVSYDNVSGVGDVISDLLARTATGATWATRRLNTNGDVYAAKMLNPIILNGIPDTFGRADLQERMITIRLARVTRRKTDTEIEADFQRLRGPLLGLLLDGVSSALRNLPNTPVPDGIRMADAAQWAEAAAPGLGIEPGRLSAAWRANRRATQGAALEVDDVARAVVTLLDKIDPTGSNTKAEDLGTEVKIDALTGRRYWEGEPTALYGRLCELAGERVTRSRAWPARPASMALHFKRIAGPLRDVHGIEVISGKGGRDSARWWSVRRV